MQEIYNKNKCQHIGKWKSNYTDKTMQIRTHIVFHSQLASHKNITVFRFRKNKACITCNKQTMEARKLEKRRMRKYTKTTTMLNKKAPAHTSKHTQRIDSKGKPNRNTNKLTNELYFLSLLVSFVCLLSVSLSMCIKCAGIWVLLCFFFFIGRLDFEMNNAVTEHI